MSNPGLSVTILHNYALPENFAEAKVLPDLEFPGAFVNIHQFLEFGTFSDLVFVHIAAALLARKLEAPAESELFVAGPGRIQLSGHDPFNTELASCGWFQREASTNIRAKIYNKVDVTDKSCRSRRLNKKSPDRGQLQEFFHGPVCE